jgi:hypothetical protein
MAAPSVAPVYSPPPAPAATAEVSPASIAPLDAPTQKMGTVSPLPCRRRIAERWRRCMARREQRRQS